MKRNTNKRKIAQKAASYLMKEIGAKSWLKDREFTRWLEVVLKEDGGILDELANR